MADLATGGLWCPSCGAEYRPGFSECTDCGVPLASEPPPPPTPEETERAVRSHDEVEYVLDDDSADTQAALGLRLRGQDVRFLFDAGRLVVAADDEAKVDLILEEMTLGPPTYAVFADPPGDAREPEPAARLIGPSDDLKVRARLLMPFLRSRWRRWHGRKDRVWPYED
jgi:hypothetical protein